MNSNKNNRDSKAFNARLPRVLVCALLGMGMATAVISGCNTVKGAGEDLERGGEKLQNSADRHGAN